ncbi:MAG TPA: hypothetical protein VGS21_12210, partial [Acidimicrobiales bacterium]|nr:hypothetical protein [Acidimicrobiales bacterium]
MSAVMRSAMRREEHMEENRSIGMTDFRTTAIDRLLAGIEAGNVPDDVFSDDASLDATVPNWRFTMRGRSSVLKELGVWFADPGSFQSLRRTPMPEGELVEFT